jgi:hypothetical protein
MSGARKDAVRRDFTINAMYYDGNTGCGGLSQPGIRDAQGKRIIHVIGDAATRWEDPGAHYSGCTFLGKLSALNFSWKQNSHAFNQVTAIVGRCATKPIVDVSSRPATRWLLLSN